MPVVVSATAGVNMSVPGGITASNGMGGAPPGTMPIVVATTPVVNVDIGNMVRLVDTIDRVRVFHPIVMPVMMAAIV